MSILNKYHVSKQLFDQNNITKYGTTSDFIISGDTITFTGASGAGNYYYNNAMLPAGNYYISYSAPNRFCYYVMASNSDLANAKLNNTSLSENNPGIASRLDLNYARYLNINVTSFSIYSDVPFIFCFAPIDIEFTISDLMLNSGNSALPFEPYNTEVWHDLTPKQYINEAFVDNSNVPQIYSGGSWGQVTSNAKVLRRKKTTKRKT